MSEKIQVGLDLQCRGQAIHQYIFLLQSKLLFLLTFCFQSQLTGEKSCCLSQEVLALDEKSQGSFYSKVTVLISLLARFQGSSDMRPEPKGLWNGSGVLSRYP